MRTLAVLWTGIAIVMLTAGISWKIVLLSLVISLVLIIFLRRFLRDNDGFFWVASVERPDLRKKKCLECDGCGLLWLDPARRQWVIIPNHLRRVDASAPYIRPPLANVRACSCCSGRGFHLVPRFVDYSRPTLAELADLPVPEARKPYPRDEDWPSPDTYDPAS